MCVFIWPKCLLLALFYSTLILSHILLAFLLINIMHKMQKIRKKIQMQHRGKYLFDCGETDNNLQTIFWKSKPKILQKILQPNLSIFPLLSQIGPHHFFTRQKGKPTMQSNAKVRKHIGHNEANTEAILSRADRKLRIQERTGISQSDLITRPLRINCPKDRKKAANGFASNQKRCCSKNEYAQILIAIKSQKKMKSSTVQVMEESMIQPITLPFLIEKRCRTVEEQYPIGQNKYSITPWDNEQDA